MDPHAAALARARDYTAANRLDQARQVLTRLLQRDPRHPEGNAAMAFVALREGFRDQAAFFAERARAAATPGTDLAVEVAKLLGHAGRKDQAIAMLEAERLHRPRDAGVRLALSLEYLMSRRPTAAVRVAREGLGLAPGDALIANNLALGLSLIGRPDEAIGHLRRAAGQDPANLTVRSNLALTLNYGAGIPPEEVLAAHRAYSDALAAQVALDPPPSRPQDPERRLTVGFLSPDFVGHSVESFIGPVVTNLDPGGFRTICFSTSVADAHDVSRLPHGPEYRPVQALTDSQLAQAIRAEGIDILIELSGHTLGHRLGVMRRRPAPVQVTYLGYPNTTGVPEIGYRLVDSLTDPAPGADARATERLVRMDPCFLCFRPPPDAPEPGPPPSAASAGTITFGSFNTLSKVNDFVVGLWARVLEAVPGSRLLLKNSGLTELESREDLLHRFVAAGVDRTRVELVAWAARPVDHLATYGRVDIGLDTYPYHGTTTTGEALWMGVPVVSLIGDVHAARVGLSILSGVGHPEWAAPTPDEFVRRAAALAADPQRLAALRAGLRERVRSSVFTDGAAMGRRFGSALRGMWRDWCRAPAPG